MEFLAPCWDGSARTADEAAFADRVDVVNDHLERRLPFFVGGAFVDFLFVVIEEGGGQRERAGNYEIGRASCRERV